MTAFLAVCSTDSRFHSSFGLCLRFVMILAFYIHHLAASRLSVLGDYSEDLRITTLTVLVIFFQVQIRISLTDPMSKIR